MGLSFLKTCSNTTPFCGNRSLVLRWGCKEHKNVVSIFPSVFYVLFQSYVANVAAFGIPWQASQSKHIFSLKDPRFMRCSQKFNRILIHSYQVCTLTSCFSKIYIYIYIYVISNLSNDRSKASSKTIPPHSAI